MAIINFHKGNGWYDFLYSLEVIILQACNCRLKYKGWKEKYVEVITELVLQNIVWYIILTCDNDQNNFLTNEFLN